MDAVGELVSETNPKNATTTHQYGALSGNTGYSYDDLGQLVKEVSPDRGTTLCSYDAAVIH